MAGQPRKYKTAEELETAIDEYFTQEHEYFLDEDNQPILKQGIPIIKKPFVPTISGLALYLGFVSRQSMYDYEKMGEYSYIIKKARLTIESFAESQLYNPAVKAAGPIFALKNIAGWKDRTETENVQKVVFISDEDADL